MRGAVDRPWRKHLVLVPFGVAILLGFMASPLNSGSYVNYYMWVYLIPLVLIGIRAVNSLAEAENRGTIRHRIFSAVFSYWVICLVTYAPVVLIYRSALGSYRDAMSISQWANYAYLGEVETVSASTRVVVGIWETIGLSSAIERLDGLQPRSAGQLPSFGAVNVYAHAVTIGFPILLFLTTETRASRRRKREEKAQREASRIQASEERRAERERRRKQRLASQRSIELHRSKQAPTSQVGSRGPSSHGSMPHDGLSLTPALTELPKEALREFQVAVRALNAAGAEHGPDSAQVEALMSDVIKKLGRALGMYHAMHIGGLIVPGSAEEREHHFLVDQMRRITGT